MKHSYFLGRESGIVNDLKDYLNEDLDQIFDFIVTPLFHPKLKRDCIGISDQRLGLITRPDTIFEGKIWSNMIVGRISEWIQLDTEDTLIRKSSEIAFRQEIEYAVHLNVPAIILPLLKSNTNIQNYASLTYESLLIHEQIEYWIPIRLEPEEPGDQIYKPWSIWNEFRLLCHSHPKLKLALYLTSSLPSESIQQLLQGENLAALFISTSLFIKDAKGYPHLSSLYYSFLSNLLQHTSRIILRGKFRHEKGSSVYIHELNSIDSLVSIPSKYKEYNDHIQIPLQPLMDNLTSMTYETFELDTPKYKLYEEAIYQYFISHSPISLPSIPSRDPQILYIMIVGAGRGPLVRVTINAAKKAKKQIFIYVIEKNLNAIITLRNMKQSLQWGDNIYHTDIRHFICPMKADLIISELLGSFGDNELDPECLEGTLPSIHDQTVYIPQKYTNYMEPLMSPIIYNHIQDLSKYIKEDPLQCTYVVKLFSYTSLSSPQPLFTFQHPESEYSRDFSRFQTLTFPILKEGTLYGFAGYFECHLYGNVYMSILPSSHTSQMYSWFPLFIPIQTPITLERNTELKVSFWRKTTHGKVWYEWCICAPITTGIHNSGGKHQWIGL